MPSRREFLTACGLGAGGLGAGTLIGLRANGRSGEREAADNHGPGPRPPDLVRPDGATQAGIARPVTPQPFVLLAVIDLTRSETGIIPLGRDQVTAWLAALGRHVLRLHDDLADQPAGQNAAGDLTVTVGLGPRLVRLLAPGSPGGTDDLPRFRDDDGIDPRALGGDVCVQLCGSDPSELRPLLDELVRHADDADPAGASAGSRRPNETGRVRGVVRWIQSGFRGPSVGAVTRNPLGFLDGLSAPLTDDELAEHVWVPADMGPVAGGTIMVIRRLRVEASRFRRLPLAQQEAIIGRRRSDGAPLSAVYANRRRDVPRTGSTEAPAEVSSETPIDLDAKSADGEYLIAPDAHVRAAHPSATGSRLMLRRGYSYDNGSAGDPEAPDRTDSGLLFISFQRDLRTFVATQHRIDEQDALSAFVTPTASGTFLVLPGFDRSRHLGTTLTA